MTQVAGAVRSFAFGDIGDVRFSADGSQIFAANASGGITDYDLATGNALRSWQVGTKLGGIDVSPDGHYVLAVERTLPPGTGSGFSYQTSTSVYRIDLGSNVITTLTTPVNGADGTFYDVAVLADGSAILSQDYGGSGFTPLTTLNIATGVFARGTTSYAQDGVLTLSSDRSEALFGPQNISDAPLYVIGSGAGVTAQHGLYADGVNGYNLGIQAIGGHFAAQFIGSLNIYDASLHYVTDLSNLYPQWAGSSSVTGLAFSPSGDSLYLLDAASDSVFELSTADWSVKRGFAVGGDVVVRYGSYGDALTISADGHYLSANVADGLQIIDLGLAVSETGGNGADTVNGDSANNTLYGFGGNDILDGRAGADVLYGGAGDDRYVVDNFGDQVIERPGDGYDTVVTSVSRTIDANVEVLVAADGTTPTLTGSSGLDTLIGNALSNQMYGGDGADTLIGNAGDDFLDGQAGADRLIGGLGNDTYQVDSRADLIFENPGEGVDTVNASTSFYLYANIENLFLVESSNASLFAVGNELDNLIRGNIGDNLLLGGAGNDAISGSFGNDSLFGEDGNDTLIGDAGVDYLAGGDGNDMLSGAADADALYGEAGNDTLDGGADFKTDILVGGDGNDILHADSGLGDYDLIDGGAGDDTYYVDTGDDLTFEAKDGGIDTVHANVHVPNGGVYLYANVENLILEGATTFGVGNELANHLTGNSSVNLLLGGDGDDVINGKDGNDVLFGQGGSDTFVFERGTGGDVIGDFQAGADKMQLSAFGFTSFADLSSHFVQVGADGAIALDQNDLVVLLGVNMTSLTAGDFML